MKKLLAIVLSLFVVSSMAFAKPTAELDFATMNKTDSQFLFQDGAKVATLDKAEMKETEGEFIHRLIWTGAKVLYKSWKTGGRTYRFGYHNAHHNFGTRKNPSWRYHFQWNTTHGTYRVPVWRSYRYKYNGGKSWWR